MLREFRRTTSVLLERYSRPQLSHRRHSHRLLLPLHQQRHFTKECAEALLPPTARNRRRRDPSRLFPPVTLCVGSRRRTAATFAADPMHRGRTWGGGGGGRRRGVGGGIGGGFEGGIGGEFEGGEVGGVRGALGAGNSSGEANDSIDALCALTNERVARARQTLRGLKVGEEQSDDEIDSEDEGEGEIRRAKATVTRPKRWVSTVEAAREKLGIHPAVRQISMGEIDDTEQQALREVFEATDRSSYPTPKAVAERFQDVHEHLQGFRQRLVARHQYDRPAKPTELLTLSPTHAAKVHLGKLDDSVRQLKKIKAKRLYLDRRRAALAGDLSPTRLSHKQYEGILDHGDYSRFDMDDVAFSDTDLRSPSVLGGAAPERDALGYEKVPSPIHDALSPHLSRFQAAALNFVTQSHTSKFRGVVDAYLQSRINDARPEQQIVDDSVEEDDQTQKKPVTPGEIISNPVIDLPEEKTENQEVALTWSCSTCHLENSGAASEAKYCPNCGTENPLWVDPNPPPRLEDVIIDIPYKYKGSDAIVLYGPDDIEILSEGQLKITLQDVLGLPAPDTKAEMAGVLRVVMVNSLIKAGLWDRHGPLGRTPFTGGLPYVIDAVAGVVLESVQQIFGMKMRWVKRALQKLNEDSEGLSRKKLKQRLIKSVRRHQAARLFQTAFRGFDKRKTFRIDLVWWRRRSMHPFFIAQREQWQKERGEVEACSEAAATIFNVQVGSIYASKVEPAESQAWHERRQTAWHQSRADSFRGRPFQRLPLGLGETETGGFTLPPRGSINSNSFKVKQLLNDGGGYHDTPPGADRQGSRPQRAVGKTTSSPAADIDGYARERKHDLARQATTINPKTGFPRLGHGIPNSHSILHFGDYQANQIQRVFRGYLGCHRWHQMACFQAIQLDDDQSLRVYVQVSRQTDASLGDPHLNERVILRRQHQHLICRRPIDIDAYDDQGYTMIMRATQAEAVQCIQALVNLGSNVNAYANVMRQMNYDPSVRLRRKGLQHEQTPEMVQATSSGTANSFDAQDQTKATEHSFKQNSNTKVHDDVKALRDDPNVDGDDLFLDGPLGCTALSLSTLASTRSAREVTRLLLEAKADVTQPQYDGKTALHIAAMSGALDGLAMLVEADGTPDYALHCVDSAGNSPLLLAAQKNHTNVIAYLGSRPEIKQRVVVPFVHTPPGWKPLPHSLLPQANNNPNGPRRVGGGYDLTTTVEQEDRGFGLDLCNNEGMSAVAIATALDYRESAWALINAGANLNLSKGTGLPALMIAVEEGNLKLVKLLLDNGADQDCRLFLHNWTEGMVAAVMGDFDILKQLYDAKNKTVFRKGDRFCDQRRQRVKFMRAWRAATCKPLHTIANARERRNEAAVLIQDMVRTAMEHRGIWKLPTPFGHVVEVESTKFGDKMTIEYHDEQKTRETNFLLEFQHLELLTERRKPVGLDLNAIDAYGNTVDDLLQMFHGIDLQRVLDVESSALHRLTKPQIYVAAEACFHEWSKYSRKTTLNKAKSVLRAWLEQNNIDRWYNVDQASFFVPGTRNKRLLSAETGHSHNATPKEPFMDTVIDVLIHRLIFNRFRGSQDFDDFILAFERVKRLLKRESARKRYSRGLRKRQVKSAAASSFQEDAFAHGDGNRFNIEFNRFGDEYVLAGVHVAFAWTRAC
eukprot:INCI4085.1.p1 GENE.INCI4085.1~~INCI4085.1.p1  ORF type:complete len:1656 (-),score=272.08 INCI4085.1:3820-8787(-)